MSGSVIWMTPWKEKQEEPEPPSSIKQDDDSLEFVPDPDFLKQLNEKMHENDLKQMENDPNPTKWKLK